jgi:hypothetical protein
VAFVIDAIHVCPSLEIPAMDDEVKDRKGWLDSIQELQIVLTFAA